jgi:hydrogenase-4 component B
LPVLLGLVAVVYLIARFALARHRRTIRRACWDGGVVRLLPEMSYTGTGFSNPVRVIFDAILQPTAVEDTRETVAEHFRTAIRRKRTSVHIVDRVVLMPVRRAGFTMANGLAAMHHGRLNAYVGYGLLALIIALLVASRWQ